MLSHKAPIGRWRGGFLLAGGKSSRMGKDKAFLDFDGKTLLERGLSVICSVCDGVTIVGDPDKFEEYSSSLHVAVVADMFPGCGPLAGIHAALTQSSSEFNLMLAVDMPFVSKKMLEFLFAAAEAENNHSIVTIPRTGRGFQPLCAVYRRSFGVVAEEALRAGRYKIDEAFSDVPIRVIDLDELSETGFSEDSFFNVNTPQDRLKAARGYRRAREFLK